MITSSLPYCIISIHAPREGGDLLYGKIRHLNQDFNPRPPRGGRRLNSLAFCGLSSISIHAPREGGDRGHSAMQSEIVISIHAPREGGDLVPVYGDVTSVISIHAPREGGDPWFLPMVT